MYVRTVYEIVSRRMQVAAAYDRTFSTMSTVRPLRAAEGDRIAYYKYPLRLLAPPTREAVKERLDAEFDVRTGTSYWPPCHLQPAYRREFGYREGDYPVAEEVLNQTIALPMHCHLTADEIRRVIHAVTTVCG